MNIVQYPAVVARIGSLALDNEQWTLWSKNTESLVFSAKDRASVEKYAKEKSCKITQVINDYN